MRKEKVACLHFAGQPVATDDALLHCRRTLDDPDDQRFGNCRHDEAFLDSFPRENLHNDVLGQISTAVSNKTASNIFL